MAITIYDTQTLMGVQTRLKTLPNFFLSMFFPEVRTFETKYIDIDQVDRGKRLAPYVSPNVQGQVMHTEGHATRRYTPAYLKPKHEVNPSQHFTRKAGEAYGSGSLSPAQRADAAVTDNMKIEREMIENRLEVMASEAIIHGQVTVSGENHPTETVEFGRDAGNTITLGAGVKWGDAGVSIINDISDWRKIIFDGSGRVADTMVVSTDVWAVMRIDAEVKDLMNKDYAGQVGELMRSILEGRGIEYVGRLDESTDIYVYSETYLDEAGADVDILPQKSILLGSAGVEGVQCFGAIQDAGSMEALEMFPKMWFNDDPSVIYTMTQSAPLTVPTNPNATFYAQTVVA